MGILGGGIEAWAGFGGKVAVAVDGGGWVAVLEFSKEPDESGFLCGCTGIGRVAVAVKTATVGYADGVRVVVETVRSGLVFGATREDIAGLVDEVMVAYGVPAPLLVPTCDVSYSDELVGEGSRAMDDKFGDTSHASPPSSDWGLRDCVLDL